MPNIDESVLIVHFQKSILMISCHSFIYFLIVAFLGLIHFVFQHDYEIYFYNKNQDNEEVWHNFCLLSSVVRVASISFVKYILIKKNNINNIIRAFGSLQK